MKSVGVYAQSQVVDFVRSFTPQVDEIKASNCELAKILIDISLEIGFLVAQTFGGAVLEPIGCLAMEDLANLT
jgi:hypothetical protein